MNLKQQVKNALLVVIITTISCSKLQAQASNPNNVKLSIGLLNKVRLVYERSLNDKFSVGSAVGAYYGGYSGLKIEPFARYYFGSECPSGLYVQTRAVFGSFTTNSTYTAINDFDVITKDVNFTAAGGGLSLGYQWLSGKNKNIVVDVALGFQVISASSELTDEITIGNTRYVPPASGLSFFTVGPGAIFNPNLNVGYAF